MHYQHLRTNQLFLNIAYGADVVPGMTPEPTYNFQKKKLTHSLTPPKKAVRVREDGPLIETQHSTSLPDLIGWHLLVEYCGRHELGHVAGTAETDGSS